MPAPELDVRERLSVALRAPLAWARMVLSEAFTPRASVYGLAPLNLPRRPTRPVSYYAFFKGWLLLSQPPGCLSLPTSFSTEP